MGEPGRNHDPLFIVSKHRMWRLPTPLSVFQAWMKGKGFEIHLSGAGKLASEVIAALGGSPQYAFFGG
jgi:hypothetical protein